MSTHSGEKKRKRPPVPIPPRSVHNRTAPPVGGRCKDCYLYYDEPNEMVQSFTKCQDAKLSLPRLSEKVTHDFYHPNPRKQFGKTCKFYAIAAGMDISFAKTLKLECCQTEIRAENIVRNCKVKTIEKTLEWVRDKGVLSKSSGKSGMSRYRIKESKNYYNPQDPEQTTLILKAWRQHGAVLGVFHIEQDFYISSDPLHKTHIYGRTGKVPDNLKHAVPKSFDPKKPPVGHCVAIVGFGFLAGKSDPLYCIYLNSHGKKFADGGYGRVLWSKVEKVWTIEGVEEEPVTTGGG